MTLKDFFDAIGKALGFDTLEGDLALICFTLFLSVIMYIVSQLWISHTNHKAERRKYEYNRSQEVNRKRFDEELKATMKLSEVFMELRILTHNLATSSEDKLEEAGGKWLQKYDEAACLVGESAPVLNTRNIADGAPTCGVHSHNSGSRSLRLIDMDAVYKSFASVGSDNTSEDDAAIDCKPSLYLRAIQFLNICAEIGDNRLKKSKGGTCLKSPLSLHLAESPKYLFPQKDYSPINKDANSVDADMELAQAYKQFIDCAFCRLRNSDTGQRDARRINRHSARRRTMERFFPILTKHDRRCPYPGNIDE